ncbi:MAG TPA: serine hydrolase, partial [Ottowia sp.]|uniref:serine hydrolase domain-containing protein n=1 Tax=Ottowia sp. TaxID=1898956 RepID=UPI002D04A77C
MMNPRRFALAATLVLAAMAHAQTPLPADASDPRTMGWMQGFPPPADKTIRFTDPDYFSFPRLRWTVCHFRELMPTAGVDRGPGAASALPVALDPGIDAVRFTPLGGDTPMTWAQAFDANTTDGLIVLQHGRIVHERYAGCLDQHTLHGAMSLTKSVTGLLGEVLVAEGALDENARVGALIPELQESAFGDATVREVLDMTTALQFSEDYAEPKAEVWAHAQAGSLLPPPPGYAGPRSYYESLQQIRKSGTHGQVFGYKTPNSDALGWLLARASGKPVHELLAERIWRRIGAEREAFYT